MLESLTGVLDVQTLLWLVIGTVIGTLIGAMPGLTGTMGVAIFIPITFALDPGTALVLLGSVYVAATYGGNLTAILIRTPGTPDSFFMTLDGYPMVQQGKASQALAITTVGAVIGGLTGVIVLLLIAPPLSQIALIFGAAEIFLVTLLGIIIIVSLAKGNMMRASLSALLGFLFATIGIDKSTGEERFTGGTIELYDGFNVIPVVIGLFAFSQVLNLIESNRSFAKFAGKIKGTGLSGREFIRCLPAALKSGIIGTFVGIIPAAGSLVASGASMNEAKRVDKEPETFGKGNPRGLMAVSSANSGVVGGSLVPLLTLSIPGNATSAVFLGGLMVHGMRPGVELFSVNADSVYQLIFGMGVATLLLLFVGFFFARYAAKVTTVPIPVLVSIIIVLTVLGSFTIANSFFDVGVMVAFGLLGYLFEKMNIPAAPLVLAFILGPIAEEQLRRFIALSGDNPLAAIANPLTIGIILLDLFVLIAALRPNVGQKKKAEKQLTNPE